MLKEGKKSDRRNGVPYGQMYTKTAIAKLFKHIISHFFSFVKSGAEACPM